MDCDPRGFCSACVIRCLFEPGCNFQRGNPVPYLTAAARISEKNPYVAVDEAKGIYISKRGECPELLEYYQEKQGWNLSNRLGAATCLLMGAEMK